MSHNDDRPSEKFLIQLYQEWNVHEQVFQIMDSKGWNYAYCLHDKDIKDDGSTVKPHYYILMVKQNASTCSAIAKNLGIDKRWVEWVESYKGAAFYINHSDEESRAKGKYQYPLSEIKGPMAQQMIDIITRKPKSKNHDNDLVKIVDWIESQEIINTSDLIRWACNEGLMSIVQRTASLVRACLSEHNDFIRTKYRIKDITTANNGLVIAENRRFAAQYHIKSEVGNQDMIKQECEQHLVNMKLIEEILENKEKSS